MKYLFDLMTKLIIFTLILSLTISLFGCGSQSDEAVSEEETNTVEESDATAENENKFDVDKAIELLKRDQEITEIFVCNSLCAASVTKAERRVLPLSSKYADFSEIQQLFDTTYVSDSGDEEFFMSYPANQEPSVINQDGRTSVFCHSGSSYTDYADYTTVAVADTQDDNLKEISFSTISDKGIKVNARRNENGEWLLEKGIYQLNPPVFESFDVQLNKVNAGSFKGLTGRILVIQLFITDKQSEFSQSDEALFYEKIVAATDYVTQTAEQFGLYPQFEFSSQYFKHGGVLGERAIDFDIMMAQTNFGNLQTFAQANEDLSGYDGYFFVVCTNKEVEASAGVCDGSEDTQLYYGERVIMGSSTTSVDICKSIFGLLGAESQPEEPEYINNLYGFYFPNDIAVSKKLETAVISPVTAFMCGFTEELDPLYRIFIPQNK